jgi:hypothetical protein
MHGARSKIPSKKSRPYIYVKFLALLGAPHLYDISMLRVNRTFSCPELLVFGVLGHAWEHVEWYMKTESLRMNILYWILVIGPSILVYILIKTNKYIKITTLLWCLVKRSCMFRRTNAIIRELIWSSQVTYMSVCITRRITEPSPMVQLRPVFLNRQAAARYRALASIIPDRER